MKKMLTAKNAAVLLIGAVLAVSVILTGNYGLSDTDKKCYEKAAGMQKEVEKIGFGDFRLADYPVAFCDGKHDYLITASEDSYSISKRKPVLDTFAATAYEVEGHYEVIAPTKEMMSRFMDIAGGAEQVITGGSELAYDEDSQAATIWHEAFHCWQLTKFEDNISALNGKHDFSEEDYGEKLIVKECDENDDAAALYREGAELLKKAAAADDVGQIRELILQYKDIQEERDKLLDETVRKLEDYYTSIEGSAYYIEAMVCRCLDEKKFEEYYMDSIDLYVKGSGKYYYGGMAQCMVLDKLDSAWKAGYDFSEPLISRIYQELGI